MMRVCKRDGYVEEKISSQGPQASWEKEQKERHANFIKNNINEAAT